jgi:multicomponent K+:H+ antiporter subunit C
MELLLASAIAVLAATGLYLLLRPGSFEIALGLTLLSYGVNLFIFAMGRLQVGRAAIAGTPPPVADPLPQALVLTAIVIGFAMTALLLVLAVRAQAVQGHDGVDPMRTQTDDGSQGELQTDLPRDDAPQHTWRVDEHGPGQHRSTGHASGHTS